MKHRSGWLLDDWGLRVARAEDGEVRAMWWWGDDGVPVWVRVWWYIVLVGWGCWENENILRRWKDIFLIFFFHHKRWKKNKFFYLSAAHLSCSLTAYETLYLHICDFHSIVGWYLTSFASEIKSLALRKLSGKFLRLSYLSLCCLLPFSIFNSTRRMVYPTCYICIRNWMIQNSCFQLIRGICGCHILYNVYLSVYLFDWLTDCSTAWVSDDSFASPSIWSLSLSTSTKHYVSPVS